MKYAKYHYGGCPVWEHWGIYYKLISKHKSLEAAKKADKKCDDCDRIEKIGKWYGRFNQVPAQVADRIRGKK